MRLHLPLGSYVSPETPLARVDARAKVLLLLVWTVALFATAGWAALALSLVLLGLALKSSRVPAADVVRGVRPAAVVLVLVFAANAVSLDGTATVAVAGPLGLDPSGAVRGAAMCLRIVVLVGLALAVSASTTPPELADAFTRLMRPLERLGVPVEDVGTALSISLRFVPLVAEEIERVSLAQRSRGVRLEEGGVVRRVSRWASVVTPVAVGLFRRADALSESMDARAYGTGKCLRERSPLTARDRVLLGCGTALAVLVWVVSGIA